MRKAKKKSLLKNLRLWYLLQKEHHRPSPRNSNPFTNYVVYSIYFSVDKRCEEEQGEMTFSIALLSNKTKQKIHALKERLLLIENQVLYVIISYGRQQSYLPCLHHKITLFIFLNNPIPHCSCLFRRSQISDKVRSGCIIALLGWLCFSISFTYLCISKWRKIQSTENNISNCCK